MLVISIRTDGALNEIERSLTTAPQWTPRKVQRTLKTLGPAAVRRMKEAVNPHWYTGALEESIRAEYHDGGMTVEIGPAAKRGKWDAGLLLELGVPHGIPRAPWGPIAAWANYRGLPAFPIWYKIRTVGVAEHPFLERTVEALEGDIEAAVGLLLDDLARTALYGNSTP